jgi:hypothetical protein
VDASVAAFGSREHVNRLRGLFGPQTQWPIAGRLPAIPDETLDVAEIEGRAVEAIGVFQLLQARQLEIHAG